MNSTTGPAVHRLDAPGTAKNPARAHVGIPSEQESGAALEVDSHRVMSRPWAVSAQMTSRSTAMIRMLQIG